MSTERRRNEMNTDTKDVRKKFVSDNFANIELHVHSHD